MLNFTCPHCGKRATSSLSETDIEYVDLGNGLPDSIFPSLPPGVERHIDQRLCCEKCHERADSRLRDEKGKKVGVHPYDPEHHTQHLRRVQAAFDKHKE